MAERKAVNKYYPPDWDPSKGSINNYVGQHPLRDRAKKLGQGILVIRFELPYNIWCGGCGAHVGMGVRYNAEKSKTGMYYSTPIYKFRMKCHLCDNYFEIQTDPKNHDYVILEGARRKEQRWDPKENEQIETTDKVVQKKMATDAMFKLEHGSDDVKKGQKVKSNLMSLETRRDEWKDDYMLNKLARHKFREEKKVLKADADSDAALLAKSSLEIPLQAESDRDIKLASLIKYRALESYDERQAKKRKEIESRPIFQASKMAKSEANSPALDKKLSIIRNTIKTAKQSSSPFDRMKMNTLGGNTTMTKQSLGIKRRCASSTAVIGLKSTLTSSQYIEVSDKKSNHETTDDQFMESDEPDSTNDNDINDTDCEEPNRSSGNENNGVGCDQYASADAEEILSQSSLCKDSVPVNLHGDGTSSRTLEAADANIGSKLCHNNSTEGQSQLEINQKTNRCHCQVSESCHKCINDSKHDDIDGNTTALHAESGENPYFSRSNNGDDKSLALRERIESQKLKSDDITSNNLTIKQRDEDTVVSTAANKPCDEMSVKSSGHAAENEQIRVSLVAAYSDSDSDP